jgi:hypothetical protein
MKFLSKSRKNIVMTPNAIPGLAVEFGAKGVFVNNNVSGNICNDPACNPDFSNQIHALTAVLVASAVAVGIGHVALAGNGIKIATDTNQKQGCQTVGNSSSIGTKLGVDTVPTIAGSSCTAVSTNAVTNLGGVIGEVK